MSLTGATGANMFLADQLPDFFSAENVYKRLGKYEVYVFRNSY